MYETFVRNQIGDKRIALLKKSDIKRYYNYLADERCLKAATIDNIHTVLHQILDMAVDDDYIRNNPSNNVLRELKKSHAFKTEKRRGLTRPEQELFLTYLKETPSNGVIYKDVCNPITAEFREELYTNILDAYEEVIRELLDLLKKNAMKEQANDVFEICSYVDGLEKKIDSMTEELTNMQNQIKEMQEDTLVNNAKKALSEAQERLNTRCEQIKSQVSEVKAQVSSTAKSIVDEAQENGRSALYRVSEFLGIKKRLLNIRENVRSAIKATDKDIAKTGLLAKGLREAGQTAANAFRTFADKPEVDYSQKEQKHPITKAVLAPMKAVKKMLVSMELHLDASIDKLDNLVMNMQFDKEKHMENAKVQEQTEPERAEAERVEAEIVYSPMVAEPQEYQYNADAFEARGADAVKQEATHKETAKIREDKAR